MDDKEDLETVYRNSGDENHIVMNERVQALAGSIYEEFEKMIGKYDQDVVQNLMPLIVNVLESLDLAFTESQENEVEVELLKEDNEQLVTQYEREKQLRKCSDQKNLELEDHFEGERKDLRIKLESLTSIVKMYELKAKNSQEQIGRLEEKENEQKKEYHKLHERYTELFKTHMDSMERAKMVAPERMDAGSARQKLPNMSLNQLNRSSGPVSFGYSELENNNEISLLNCDTVQTPGMEYSASNIKRELGPGDGTLNRGRRRAAGGGQTTEKGGNWVGDDLSPEMEDKGMELVQDISQDPSVGPGTPLSPSKSIMCQSHTKSEKRLGNNLYQELSFQDNEVLGEVDEGADLTDSDNDDGVSYRSYDNALDNYYGMGKEVENLISENNELLATKNALNIVKDDLIAKVDELTGEHEILREEVRSLQEVRSRQTGRVEQLEEEIKQLKEVEKEKKEKEEEEEVPMAQRKRFTRVEMARVLMERNQYKERFMELQEAVRWTEMIRASKTSDTPMDKKNNKGIWKFFSNLFSGTERGPNDNLSPYMTYSNSEENLGPLSTMRTNQRNQQTDRRASSQAKGTDVFDGEAVPSDKLTARRAQERKEQYKQVRAHVKKDDGRLQAYGWSLPAKSPTAGPKPEQEQTRSTVPVPVPVYCRPLMEKEQGMKIWCAAGVNMTGGKTKDGGEIVGASVFYSSPPESETRQSATGEDLEDEISKLDAELKEGGLMSQEQQEQSLSSLVWICTSTQSVSKVTVIDANNPAEILESFHVCSSHLLCIASVPGAKEDDYKVDTELNKIIVDESRDQTNASRDQKSQEKEESKVEVEEEPKTTIGSISFVSCGTGDETVEQHPLADKQDPEVRPRLTRETAQDVGAEELPAASSSSSGSSSESQPQQRISKDHSNKIRDGISEISKDNEFALSEAEKMSSVLPTMWLGSQSGSIYVHSGVSQWKRCIHSIRLKDSVLSIVHVKGRVLAAMADGTVAIFHRDQEGQWDLRNYYLLDLGRPHHSIRCMVQVHSKVWLGYRNRIHVIDPRLMSVEASFDAHPRKESQVRQMAWVGDGVWVSIRLDSTLRLYHAHTHEHLQDVDIEPYVSKMLGTGKLGFSFVRITALMVSCTRLWLGTGNGVIISVPLSKPSAVNKSSSGNLIADVIEKSTKPGAPVRVYSDNKDRVIPASFIPYCSMAQAQLSFHGHRDAVKFFVSVPGHGGLSLASGDCEKVDSMLAMSGGEGYIDFRLVEDGTEHDFDSHIMVWNVTDPTSAVGGSSSAAKGAAAGGATTSLSSSANSLRPVSTTSSSLDLGPTPGSGVGLDSLEFSENYIDSDSETDTLPLSVVSKGSSETKASGSLEPAGASINTVTSAKNTSNNIGSIAADIETGTDPLQWSEDIESMLNNPPPDTFQSFHLAAEPSLSSWVVPQYAQDQLNIDKMPATRPYQVDFGRKKSRSRSRSLQKSSKDSTRKDSIASNGQASTPSLSSTKESSPTKESLTKEPPSTPSSNGSVSASTRNNKEQTPSSSGGLEVDEPLEDFTQLLA